ncbi:MAG: cyclic nucleotide-binding domain-containing protein [Polyangiaceae bacterium]|nr:cyclic nucleotide-binding domain-containing protein [Polyangiaceae bacterium]
MRTAAPVLPGSSHTLESPIDRALSLLFANEREAALRWAAAIVKHDPLMATGLVVCGRLLGDLGRQEVGREACKLAVSRAIDLENLPLAVVAARQFEELGGDPNSLLDEIAEAFCRDSPRLGEGMPPPPPLPPAESFQPLHAVLMGASLLNKATEIVHEAHRQHLTETARPGIAQLPLFSKLDCAGLRALVGAFSAEWIPETTRVVEQGSEGTDAYFVARGELHAERERDGETVTLSRLTNGAVFGEMALLSRAPRAAGVFASRPTIVVRVSRDALDGVVSKHPEVGDELSVFARERMVSNLIRMSELFALVREEGRSALVAGCTPRLIEKGQVLFFRGRPADGVHLIASGEVSQTSLDESGEPLVRGTLSAGDVVGHDSLVLRRPMEVEVVALHPTVTLFLSEEDFHAVIDSEPRILLALYKLAVRSDSDAKTIREEATTVVDDSVLV